MCHLLIIEDDFFISDYIVQLAEASGATSVSQAMSQQEAIDLAREHRPEMIMSDVQLVEGTGPLAVQAIIAEMGSIPVIFITANPRDCEPCDPSAVVLSKPINGSEVTRHFRQLAPV